MASSISPLIEIGGCEECKERPARYIFDRRFVCAKCLPHVQAAIEKERVPLSAREQQVVALVAKGQSNPEIAEALGLTTGTVGVYVRQALLKLHLRNRAELAAAWGLQRARQA